MLVRVGYYRPDEVTIVPHSEPDPDDEVMRMILDSGQPAHIKKRMIERLDELRARERAREAEEVAFWIEQARGA